ncbi:hypothetical protein LTR27_000966 [Elasticomyces elasticus]|nr:hypothetical protein LTR27_000966 [Elasticomyces elasticus]
MLPLGRGLLYGLGLVSFAQHTASQNWDGPSLYVNGTAPDVVLGDTWNSSYPMFEGIEESYPPLINGTDWVNGGENVSRLETRAAKNFYLRVMPLGASITQGFRSSDGNGYRKSLRQQLRWKGWKVNMVGTKSDGNMADNDNEGHIGWRIDQIYEQWKKSAVNELKPNLVLINAGTNDCGQNFNTADAGARMKVLIDDIYSKLPDVTIVLSTLVISKANRVCAEDLSKQFRNLAASYRGKRMGLADIESAISMSQLNSDGIHPNDEGYKLFAGVWWQAISKLEDVIQPPPTDGLIKDDSTGGGNKCKKVAGNASGPIQTQRGSGHDDGNFKYYETERGVIESARIQKVLPDSPSDAGSIHQIPFGIKFANIIKNDPNSDRSVAVDDWIRIYTSTSGKDMYYFRQNLGGGKFGPSKAFDPGMKCSTVGSNQYFGDFNGDGLDDFFCISEGASVWVSLNRGGSPPKFESIGMVIGKSDGFVQEVSIVDIDGDGRADFCILVDSAFKCSRNTGKGDKYTWQGFSKVDGIRDPVLDVRYSGAFFFGDVNGDYRQDFIRITDQETMEIFTNHRGRGKGIVPEWVSSGAIPVGRKGLGEFEGQWDVIKFGRIYGSNRVDYILIREEEDYYDVLVWENKGVGGTKLKADGTFYCDMRGTGSDDYVWIYADGHSDELFANTHNPPNWDWKSNKITLKVSAPRTLIHLADWTGNGRCDVLVQNRATSAVTLLENQWNAATKTLTFANRGVVASPGCGASTGTSIFDRNMRIADME